MHITPAQRKAAVELIYAREAQQSLNTALNNPLTEAFGDTPRISAMRDMIESYVDRAKRYLMRSGETITPATIETVYAEMRERRKTALRAAKMRKSEAEEYRQQYDRIDAELRRLRSASEAR